MWSAFSTVIVQSSLRKGRQFVVWALVNCVKFNIASLIEKWMVYFKIVSSSQDGEC